MSSQSTLALNFHEPRFSVLGAELPLSHLLGGAAAPPYQVHGPNSRQGSRLLPAHEAQPVIRKTGKVSASWSASCNPTLARNYVVPCAGDAAAKLVKRRIAQPRCARRFSMLGVLLTNLICLHDLPAAAASPAVAAKRGAAVPVIYCTDLFHPHVDPDDHFDLATLFAMPELDIKGIVLDQGDNQLRHPGRIPVSQMSKITGRTVPIVIGLSQKLRTPEDKGLEQPAQFQGGVGLILETLRQSKVPVRIAAVGSLRDVAAAFNREPSLFRTKVAMLLIFIGEASDPKFQEYNVGLDPQAFIGLMRSGLPIYWVPCFDGGPSQNRGHASFWRARHADLLQGAAPIVIQYFIYALEKEQADPLGFLDQPVDPARKARLFAGTRNLWCTAIFGVMSGRRVRLAGTNYVSEPPTGTVPSMNGPDKDLFGFTEVDITVSPEAVVRYGSGPDSRRVKRFEILDAPRFAEAMTAATADLLGSLGK
jgi:hypothetical protein